MKNVLTVTGKAERVSDERAAMLVDNGCSYISNELYKKVLAEQKQAAESHKKVKKTFDEEFNQLYKQLTTHGTGLFDNDTLRKLALNFREAEIDKEQNNIYFKAHYWGTKPQYYILKIEKNQQVPLSFVAHVYNVSKSQFESFEKTISNDFEIDNRIVGNAADVIHYMKDLCIARKLNYPVGLFTVKSIHHN